jgi:hypothetical protein
LAAAAALGLILALAAVFAFQLGIDRNPDWGPSRVFLFGTGIALLLLAILLGLADRLRQSRLWRTAADGWIAGRQRLSRRLRGSRAWVELSARAVCLRDGLRRRALAAPLLGAILRTKDRIVLAATSVVVVAVIAVYLWIVSVGRWTSWPGSTEHYNLLAAAFLHGQTHLLIEPDPALLALEDPYDVDARSHIRILWDATLYDGKYYLYWGPVPALLLAGAKAVHPAEIGDEQLVFVMVSATLIMGAALVLSVWRYAFRDLPWWTPVICILGLGMATPLPWLLNRPAVYEAAIATGQFFLLAGITAAFVALRDEAPPRRLLLVAAGTCWALAVGSRSSMAVGVVFLAAATGVRILRLSGFPRSRRIDWTGLLALGVPLLLGATLLGGYNYARFGSVLEFGHRYQLGRWNKRQLYDQVFAGGYILPNLFNYFVNPFRTLSIFPYVKPAWGEHLIVPLHLKAPRPYHTEQITGLLLAAPFAVFAVLPAVFRLRDARARRRSQAAGDGSLAAGPGASSVDWLLALAYGAIAALFAPLMILVSITERHLTDVMPLIILLASIGFWQGRRRLLASGRSSAGFTALAICLILATVVLGWLLAITGYQARFEHLNPELFERLTRWLTW